MTMLAGTSFPAPRSFPTESPVNYFGLTNSEQDLGGYVPSLLGSPTSVSQGTPDATGRSAAVNYLGTLTDGALGPENDPATWTQEEAAAQTDRALARIGQSNPELAQKLAEMHGKSEGEDLPWYKDIMKGVGEFLHATKLDVVFDYLGRASHVLPEIVHDWGKESVWENAGQALTGEVDTNWADVLVDNMGMERNFWTAAAGFAGDVLTDPLTYVTFGAGGIGRAAVGKTVAEAGGAAALKAGTIQTAKGAVDLAPMMKAISQRTGIAADDFDGLARVVFGLTEPGAKMAAKGGSGLMNRFKTALGKVHPDAKAGAAFVFDNELALAGGRETIRLMDDVFRQSTTGGWQRLSKEAAEKMGVAKDEVDDMLRGMVSQGTGIGVAKTLYTRGKSAAAGLGGPRIRMSIPVIDLRLAGMKLPLMPKRMDFSMGRRFMAGISGQVKLMRMVGEGSATMEDMHIFWEKGFKELEKRSPKVAKQLGGRGGSIFYTASEGIGGVTKHFSAHATQLRGGGLAAKYAADTNIQGRHMVQQTTDEILTVTRPDGSVLRPDQTRRRFVEAASKAGATGPEAKAEFADLLNEYRSLVPAPGSTAKDFWAARITAFIQQHQGQGNLPKVGGVDNPNYSGTFDEQLAAMREQASRAEEVEKQIADMSGDSEIADIWRTFAEQRDQAELNAGLIPDHHNADLAQVNDIQPEDAALYSDGTVYTSETIDGGSAIGIEQLRDGEARGLILVPRGKLGDAPNMGNVPESEFNELLADMTDGGSWFGGLEEGSLAAKARAGRDAAEGDLSFEALSKGMDDADLKELRQALDNLRAKKAEVGGGGATHRDRSEFPEGPMGDLAYDLNEGMANQTVKTLSPEEARFLHDPDVVITGPQDILTVDRRTTATLPERQATQADETVDRVAEIHDTYGKVLDDIEAERFQFSEELSPDTVQAVKDIVARMGSREEQLADITTAILQAEGKTGLRILDDTGERTILFYDRGTGAIPAARVNARAPQVASATGSQLRAVTDLAKEAVLGVNRNSGETIIQSILRRVRDMPRAQAERQAKKILSENGIELPEGHDFFEKDAVRVLKEATDTTGRRVSKRFMGEAAREAESLGLSRGGFGAGQAGLGRFRVVLNEANIKALEELSQETKAAAEVAARLTDETLPQLSREVDELVRMANEAENALNHLIEYGPAREQSILTTIARQGNDQANLPGRQVESIDPTEATRKLAKHTSDIRLVQKALAEGKTADRYTQLSENVWRVRSGTGDDVAYVYLRTIRDEAGELQVVSARHVAQRALTGAEDNASRFVSSAYTDPAHRVRNAAGHGRTYGDELVDAHWKDLGIRHGTAKEQLDKMERAVAAQQLSEKGAKLAGRAVKRNVKELHKEVQKRAKLLAREAESAKREMDRARVSETEAINEVNSLRTRAQTERAPALLALRPAEDAKNMAGMSTLRVPGFENMAMPAFMAEEFERAMAGYPKLDGAHAAFRTFNGWWKSMATWLMPSFHMRNLQGAFFNNWLGGVHIRDYIVSGRVRRAERELAGGAPGKWAKTTIKESDKELYAALKFAEPTGYIMGVPIDELTYADMANLGAGLNLTASNGRLFAEAEMTVERAEKQFKGGKGYLGRVPQPYTKLMRGAGTMTENVFRTASFVSDLRQGRSIMESRAMTMMRHGDYEDMTDWEYKWVRDLIPFYKWMRTNTPFQIHQLLENPAKLLAVQKAQMSVYDAKGLEYSRERERVPDWMQHTFTIPKNVEGGTFDTFMLDLPMSDMFMGGREFISSFLPTVRPFLESYIFQQQTFSGAPLKGKQLEMNPAFGVLAPLLDAVGLTSRGPDGKQYMSDKTQNLLGVIPLYSRFKNFIYEDPKRVKQRSNLFMSGVLGIGGYAVDEEVLADAELSFYYDNVLPAVEYMRGVGYELPSTEDLAQTVGTTDQILMRLGITPGPVEGGA